MNDFLGLLAASPSDWSLFGMELEWILLVIVWACVFAAKAVACVLVLCLGWYVRQTWPEFHERVEDGIRERPGLSLCAGALTQLALGIVTSVLVLTIVGIPLAILLVTLSIVATALGVAVLAEVIGKRLPMASLREHPERQLVMGLAVVLAVSLIPLLGDALLMLAVIAGSGAVAMAILSAHGARTARRESVVTY
jgi:hypothetical protein